MCVKLSLATIIVLEEHTGCRGIGSNYAKMAGSDVTIQTTALDHLVGETQTRPSVLIDVYGVVGGVLGMITRGAPRELGNAVSGSVDEAV